jgi:hypothetical protein
LETERMNPLLNVLLGLALWVIIGLSAYAVFAHDWYSGAKNAVGTECCDDRDCQPVEECSSPGDTDIRVVIDGKCVPVPPEAVLGFYSPDFRAHACWARTTIVPSPRCVILPGRGA